MRWSASCSGEEDRATRDALGAAQGCPDVPAISASSSCVNPISLSRYNSASSTRRRNTRSSAGTGSASTRLLAGTAADAQTLNLGASGAIAAVLGAYLILFPGAQIRGLIGFWPVRLSVVRGERRALRVECASSGIAFFAHVGRFVFGAVVARPVVARGRLEDDEAPRRVWA